MTERGAEPDATSGRLLPLAPATACYIDTVRAVAAMAVVLGHLWPLMVGRPLAAGDGFAWTLFYGMAGFAHPAVIAFFVLSGFLITRIVVARSDRPGFWGGYLIDRFARLETVLLPALLLGLVVDTLGAPIYFATPGVPVYPPDLIARLSPSVFLANLTFLQTVAAPTFGSNGPLWSLAYEFWYYLWFPALWLLGRRRRPSWMLLSLIIIPFAHPMFASFPCWLAGSLAYFAYDFLRARSGAAMHRGALALQLGGALAFAVVSILLRWRSGVTYLLDYALAASFALLLLGWCLAPPRFPRWLGPFAWFGRRASFSLYAIHRPVLMFAIACILPGRRADPGPLALGLSVALFLGILSIAALFAWCTERNTASVRAGLRRLTGRAPRKFASDKDAASR